MIDLCDRHVSPRSASDCAGARRSSLMFVAGLTLLWAILAGCSLRGRFEPVYTITLHDVVRPGSMAGRSVRQVRNYEGTETITVANYPRITSREIVSAVVMEPNDPDGDLRVDLHLTRRGALRWLQLCHERPGEKLALVLDGFYRFTVEVPIGSAVQPDTIRVAGPWLRQEAEAVASHAAANYKSYHQL